MAKVEVFQNVGQRTESRSPSKKCLYQRKGTCKIQSPTFNGSKVNENVKSFLKISFKGHGQGHKVNDLGII